MPTVEEKNMEIQLRKNIGKRIEEILLQSGLQKTQIQSRMDCSWDTVHKWTKGNSIPKHIQLIKFCAIMNVSTDYILTGKHPEAGNEKINEMEMDIKDYKDRIEELKDFNALLKEKIETLEAQLGEFQAIKKRG